MSTTLQVRVDEKTKSGAQKVLSEMGLDLSSGIKMFLRQLVNTGAMPFTPRTENGFTAEQEQEVLREIEDTLENGKSYDSVEEMHRAILSESD